MVNGYATQSAEAERNNDKPSRPWPALLHPPAWNLNVYTYQWLQQRLNLSSVELVLWTEHQQERRGESGEGWRVTKVAAIARVRFIGRNIQLQITSVQQRRHFSLKLTWMKFKSSPPPPSPPLFGFWVEHILVILRAVECCLGTLSRQRATIGSRIAV
jgi:hypothetical protein